VAIFGKLRLEATVQVDDLTRLSAIATTVSKDENAITLVEIEPEAGNGFIDVSNAGALSSSNWFLDWAFATDGTKTVTLRVTAGATGPVTFSKTIEVLTEVDDKLFSTDNDLQKHEPDILNWIVPGRNTFLDYHRRAQTLILDYYRVNGYRTQDGSKITKAELIDLSEVREWATFLTLKLIMLSRSNEVDDVFRLKANDYESKMIESRESVFTSYDWNKDGNLEASEQNIQNNVIEVEKL
jgi:hypothetical protein